MVISNKSLQMIEQQFSVNSKAVPHIIGKKGSKIKELQAKTNTKIRLTDQRNGSYEVTISGSQENVEKAKVLIRSISNNSIRNYYHSELIVPVLHATENTRLIIHKFKGFAINPSEMLFALEFKKLPGDEYDKVVEKLKRMTTMESKKDIIRAGSQEVQEMYEKMADMINKTSGDIECVAVLGKTLWYSAKRDHPLRWSEMDIEDFLNLKIGYNKDIKSTFSTYAGTDEKEIEKYLLQNGFKEVENNHYVAVHLVDVIAEERFCVRLKIEEKDALKLVRVIKEKKKMAIMNNVNNYKTLDVRIRIEQVEDHKIKSELDTFIKEIRYKDKKIVLPNSNLFSMDEIRDQKKKVFEKDDLTVFLVEVFDKTNQQKFIEVEIQSQKLQKLIQAKDNKIINQLKSLIQAAQNISDAISPIVLEKAY